MLARAWSWQRAIDEGRYANGKELADAQPQDGQRRRDVARHDAIHNPGREHREAQRPRDAGAVDAKRESLPLDWGEQERELLGE